jgi:transcriptional regulator with XRE-family HTH domain
MSNAEGQPLTPSEWVAKRVRAVRKSRGWSVKDLAARCQQVGYPELTAGALYVLEGPRPRSVTVDEWLVLAYALDVPPLTLALPTENADYSVTPTFTTRASRVANWLIGKDNLEPDKRMMRRLLYTAQWYEALPYLFPGESPDNAPALEDKEAIFVMQRFFNEDFPLIEGPKYPEALTRIRKLLEAKLATNESDDSTGGAE